MPAGAVGSCWAAGSWSATCWEANTWADAAVALVFHLDMNERLVTYLRDYYSLTSGDLTPMTTRYLNELTGESTARFKRLEQDATDAT